MPLVRVDEISGSLSLVPQQSVLALEMQMGKGTDVTTGLVHIWTHDTGSSSEER